MMSSNGSNDLITEILYKYADTVRRVCFMYLRDQQDVEDVFQDVFLKLIQNSGDFHEEEHMKAWLIRITINKCKDLLKSYWRKNTTSMDDVQLPYEDKLDSGLMKEVLALPDKYKDIIYLFYYEEYSVPQISKLLGMKENTVYSNLHRARIMLKQRLGGTDYEFSY